MIVGRILSVIFFVVQQRRAHSQFAVRTDIQVEGSTGTAVNAIARDDHGLVRANRRIVDRGVDDAGATTVAEEDGVGATLDINPGNIVAIPRDIGDEKITGVVSAVEAPHAGRAVGGEAGIVIVEGRAIPETAKLPPVPPTSVLVMNWSSDWLSVAPMSRMNSLVATEIAEPTSFRSVRMRVPPSVSVA